jgi:hypothetical protein
MQARVHGLLVFLKPFILVCNHAPNCLGYADREPRVVREIRNARVGQRQELASWVVAFINLGCLLHNNGP